MCWEFMRTQTARRLRGRVDVVIGGSNWWSIPNWRPRAVTERMEQKNLALAHRAPAVFGRFVGAPVVQAAMCGRISCPMPDMPASATAAASKAARSSPMQAGAFWRREAPTKGPG